MCAKAYDPVSKACARELLTVGYSFKAFKQEVGKEHFRERPFYVMIIVLVI